MYGRKSTVSKETSKSGQSGKAKISENRIELSKSCSVTKSSDIESKEDENSEKIGEISNKRSYNEALASDENIPPRHKVTVNNPPRKRRKNHFNVEWLNRTDCNGYLVGSWASQ